MTKIEEKILELYRIKKKGLIALICFGALYLIATVLFIVFSNYRFEIMLMIIGSLICGTLLIAFLYCLLNLYLFTKTQIDFYQCIKLEKENNFEIEIDELEQITVSKNIHLYCIEHEDKKIMFLPFIDVSSLKGKYIAHSLGDYVYEVIRND